MNYEDQVITEFVQNALFRLDANTRMLSISLGKLSEEQIWQRPNAASNSVGNLILHLCGNISQYAISSLGGTADNRKRNEEFSTQSGYNKTQLLKKLTDVVAEAKVIIQECSIENWVKIRKVQGFSFSGIGVVLHVVEHYSYHIGQIAFWTKQTTNADLGFYDGVDLTVTS
tara:strand:- start:4688 stop:5200 length:513 start_codon:yes stop_codon:yes gene_type:complete